MKICIIGTRGFPKVQGGTEKHCEMLYPKFGEEYDFIVYRRKPYVVATPAYPHIRFKDLPSTRIKGFEAAFHSFIATICAVFSDCELIHYHNIGPAMFSWIAKLAGKKVVLTYHSANYEHEKWGKMARCLLRLCERIALSCADRIIFVSKFQLEKYSDKVQQKSVYIPNGIPETVATTRTDYIRSLGLEKGHYVLGIGRITPEKGFDVLIRAFEQVNTDYKLVIAGSVETESEYLTKLKQLVKSDRVIFTGYVEGENLNELYSHAGLYVLSSRNEGFPIVLLEAMSYGLDVLVSDIPATHLVSLEASDYFQKEDVEDLIQQLEKKFHCMDIVSRRSYDLTRFNWLHIAKDTANVYKET